MPAKILKFKIPDGRRGRYPSSAEIILEDNQLEITDENRKSVNFFLSQMSFDEVYSAAHTALHWALDRVFNDGKVVKKDDAFRYFCKICWRKIKKEGGQ